MCVSWESGSEIFHLSGDKVIPSFYLAPACHHHFTNFHMENKNLLGSFLWLHHQAVVWSSLFVAFEIIADLKSAMCVPLQDGELNLYVIVPAHKQLAPLHLIAPWQKFSRSPV